MYSFVTLTKHGWQVGTRDLVWPGYASSRKLLLALTRVRTTVRTTPTGSALQGIETRYFEAWKPVSGARVTGRIKMEETRLSVIDISISTILL